MTINYARRSLSCHFVDEFSAPESLVHPFSSFQRDNSVLRVLQFSWCGLKNPRFGSGDVYFSNKIIMFLAVGLLTEMRDARILKSRQIYIAV